MVAEQRETVQRIDADVVDIASNVSGAQRELLKYFASISSNRWLMLKIFGVLIVFVRPLAPAVCLNVADMPKVFTIYIGFLTVGAPADIYWIITSFTNMNSTSRTNIPSRTFVRYINPLG